MWIDVLLYPIIYYLNLNDTITHTQKLLGGQLPTSTVPVMKAWSSPWAKVRSVCRQLLGRGLLFCSSTPAGLRSCLHACTVICCLLFGWMSWSGTRGARFWHNDWLQSCGSPLWDPTVSHHCAVAVQHHRQEQYGWGVCVCVSGGEVRLYQWQHNKTIPLSLLWLTETIDTEVTNIPAIQCLVIH